MPAIGVDLHNHDDDNNTMGIDEVLQLSPPFQHTG